MASAIKSSFSKIREANGGGNPWAVDPDWETKRQSYDGGIPTKGWTKDYVDLVLSCCPRTDEWEDGAPDCDDCEFQSICELSERRDLANDDVLDGHVLAVRSALRLRKRRIQQIKDVEEEL